MLHNAATEPEVVEFALFLKRMGAIAPTQAGPPMLPPRLVRRCSHPGWSADSYWRRW